MIAESRMESRNACSGNRMTPFETLTARARRRARRAPRGGRATRIARISYARYRL